MGYDPELVIHDGQLIPRGEAFALMLEEFTPFGYSVAVVQYFVARAHRATQFYLSELRWTTPEVQKLQLGEVLKADGEMADKWRAQSREAREAHAKKSEKEMEVRQKAQLEREKFVARYKEERAQDDKRREEKRRERERKEEFDLWVKKNESGGWKAEAAARAASRKERDQRTWESILRRIRENTDPSWVPPWLEGGTKESMLNLLSDHEYIEWMFACYAHELDVRE